MLYSLSTADDNTSSLLNLQTTIVNIHSTQHSLLVNKMVKGKAQGKREKDKQPRKKHGTAKASLKSTKSTVNSTTPTLDRLWKSSKILHHQNESNEIITSTNEHDIINLPNPTVLENATCEASQNTYDENNKDEIEITSTTNGKNTTTYTNEETTPNMIDNNTASATRAFTPSIIEANLDVIDGQDREEEEYESGMDYEDGPAFHYIKHIHDRLQEETRILDKLNEALSVTHSTTDTSIGEDEEEIIGTRTLCTTDGLTTTAPERGRNATMTHTQNTQNVAEEQNETTLPPTIPLPFAPIRQSRRMMIMRSMMMRSMMMRSFVGTTSIQPTLPYYINTAEKKKTRGKDKTQRQKRCCKLCKENKGINGTICPGRTGRGECIYFQHDGTPITK